MHVIELLTKSGERLGISTTLWDPDPDPADPQNAGERESEGMPAARSLFRQVAEEGSPELAKPFGLTGQGWIAWVL